MKFLITVGIALCMSSAVATAADDNASPEGLPKPVFILSGAKNDQGWQQAIDEARTRTEADLKITIPYAENVSETAADVASASEAFIKQGYNLIVGNSSKYVDAFDQLAGKYPKVSFINIQTDIDKAPKARTVVSAVGRGYESQYLCGIVAGSATKSGNIGFIAEQASIPTNWEINAYTMGVRSLRPDATVHVIFTGGKDSAKERAAATALIDRGADILGQSIEGPVPQMVAAERNVSATGHGLDLHDLTPKSTLCSTVWVWDRYLALEMKKIAAGNWTSSGDVALPGMTGGATDIACCNETVSEQAMDKVNTERDGIIISANKVFNGTLADNTGNARIPADGIFADSDLRKMDWYVKGVVIDK